MISAGIQLRRIYTDEVLLESQDKCIICQENGQNTVAHKSGKDRISEVARLRQDKVYERLKKFGSNFVYHTGNKCYKNYTHKKNLHNLNCENNNTTLEQYESKASAVDSKCVICDCKSHNGNFEKCKITDATRAQKFLDAKAFFKDAVNDRTINLIHIKDIFEQSIYCHKDCIRSYIRKFEQNSLNVPKEDSKKTMILNYFKTLIPQLKSGIGFPLSDIRNNISLIHKLDVSNKYIQQCVFEEFGDEIRLGTSTAANKSAIIFHSSVRIEEVIDFLRGKDDYKDCGKKLREIFKTFDFGLKDEFSDATNLNKAWQNFKIPKPVLSFFAELFNFNISDFEEEQYIGNAISQSKWLKLQALFQIIYYYIHNGNQTTPLHVMNGLAIHDACRSSTLIKSMNHIGVSVSYDEILRYRNDLATYTVLNTNKDNVPLPSHFDVNMFTTAAFDNFDHNECTFTGSGSSHDTVSVLFQDKPPVERKKPTLTELSLKHRARTFRLELNCQNIKDFQTPPRTAVLPENYVADKNKFTMDPELYDRIRQKELAWEVCRLNHQGQSEDISLQEQVVPTWSAFNSVLCQEKKTETQILGFLPIIPRPVTDYGTVYTALHNFLNVLEQLKQSKLPVTCDEGVYQIARHIKLSRPKEFDNIVLLMGPFHLVKIILACIGQYLKGSGADTIFMGSSVFGPAVTASVLNAKDYARSLKAFISLSEALRRLQLTEFFKKNDINLYSAEIEKLAQLRQSFAEKNDEKCKSIYKEYTQLPNHLQKDFEKFIKVRRAESELFKYWDNVIHLVSMAKDAVRAERERNGVLHLATVQKVLPLFAVFNRYNYLRWASVYMEDMRQLETSDPELHNQLFVEGKVFIKRSARPYSSVGADMALEQSINRSKKSTSGVIGKTRSKSFVTEWELIYHEVLEVSNLYRNLTKVTSNNNYELRHHEYTEFETKRMEEHIESMRLYILEIGNPFAEGANKLINIATQQEIPEEFKNGILEVVQIGEEIYEKFRKKRFIEKTEMISSVIHQSNISMFSSKVKSTDGLNTNSGKKSSFSMRIIDLARERGYSLEKLFSFELVDNQFFIDRTGLLSKGTGSIMTELEKTHLNLETATLQDNSDCCCIINVMYHITKFPTAQLKTFGDLVTSFLKSITRVIPSKTTRIDFIFESILKFSLKKFENIRLACEGNIRMNKIEKDTPLPATMSLFWHSTQNEMKLQHFIKKFILNSYEFAAHMTVFCSAIICEDERSQCEAVELINRKVASYPDLEFSYLEQSYMRTMPHILHAAKEGYKKVIIWSGGDDESILSLYHWRTFHLNGLQELWIRLGSAATTRNVPLHALGVKLGEDRSKAILPAHIVTGSSRTSKFGTKHAAANIPHNLLEKFGQTMVIDSPLFEETIENAERFLVQVIKMGSRCKSLSELRLWIYLFGNFTSLENLPPTSRSTREHLLRSLYHTNIARNCLKDSNDQIECQQFGYVLIENTLRPRHNVLLYPDESELVPSCNCGKCARKSCPCFQAGKSCCMFCKCNNGQNAVCRNAFTIENDTTSKRTAEKLLTVLPEKRQKRKQNEE